MSACLTNDPNWVFFFNTNDSTYYISTAQTQYELYDDLQHSTSAIHVIHFHIGESSKMGPNHWRDSERRELKHEVSGYMEMKTNYTRGMRS